MIAPELNKWNAALEPMPFDDVCRSAGAATGDDALNVLRHFSRSERPAARAAAVQGIEYMFDNSPLSGDRALPILLEMMSREKVKAISSSLKCLVWELTERRRRIETATVL